MNGDAHDLETQQLVLDTRQLIRDAKRVLRSFQIQCDHWFELVESGLHEQCKWCGATRHENETVLLEPVEDQ